MVSDFLSISRVHEVTHYMTAIYNNNCLGMITYVHCLISQRVRLIPYFQIFKDRAAYWGCLKAMGCKVVKLHYRADLNPDIDISHNSSQREDAIAHNLRKVIDESLFLHSPLDPNVSLFS